MNVQHTSWPMTAKCSLFFFPNTIFFEFMSCGGGVGGTNHPAIFIYYKSLKFLKPKRKRDKYGSRDYYPC